MDRSRCDAVQPLIRPIGPHRAESLKDVSSFAVVQRVRTVGEHTRTERVYCISGLPSDGERITVPIRSPWEVESRLHWCLDVQFDDDYARGRIHHVAHQSALVRHMALNLIRLDKSIKTSIRTQGRRTRMTCIS